MINTPISNKMPNEPWIKKEATSEPPMQLLTFNVPFPSPNTILFLFITQSFHFKKGFESSHSYSSLTMRKQKAPHSHPKGINIGTYHQIELIKVHFIRGNKHGGPLHPHESVSMMKCETKLSTDHFSKVSECFKK